MTTEQMNAAPSEQAPAEIEQAQPVAVDAAAPVAETSGTVADFDLSTVEGIRKAAERFPELKNWREEGYGAGLEAGKQRARREIELDEGNLDRARGTVKWAAEQIEAGADPDEIAKQIAPHVARNQDWARAEVLRGLIAQARELDETAVAPLAELAESLQGNADEIEKVAQTALNAVANRSGAAGRQALLDTDDIDSLPDSKLKSAIQARIEREMAAELSARQVEASKPDPLPASPAGSSTEPMTPARFQAMPPEARREYARQEAAAGRSLWHLAAVE